MSYRALATTMVAITLAGCAATRATPPAPAAPTATVVVATHVATAEPATEIPQPTATGSAPEETPTSAIPSASATPPQGGLDPATARWAPAGRTNAGPPGGDLVGFDKGYVTVEARGNVEEPIAWFSADGETWDTTSLANSVPNCPGWGPDGDEDVPDADTAAIATNGHEVVVVGSWHPHDEAACASLGYWPMAWLTTDGTTWQRSEPFFADQGRGRATAVWAVQGGWQAIVDDSLWQSPDGLRWHAAGELAGFHAATATGMAANGTVVLSRIDDERLRLFASGDGRTWAPIDAAGDCRNGGQQIVAPASPGLDAWVVLGDPRVCSSTDLIHWSSHKLPMAVWRIAQTRFGAIAIGDTCHGAGTNCPDPGPRAYITTDGATWSRLAHPDVYWYRSLADGPAGVLLIGTGPHDDNDAQAWRLEP